MTVSAARVSNRPVGCGIARLVELHHLDLQLRAVEGGDRAEPVDAHAFPLGVLGLLGMSRHLVARPPVDDHRVVGAEAARDPGCVHGRVTAPVDSHSTADHGMLTGGDAAQERHCVDDPPRVPGGDVDTLRQVRPDRDEDGVEPALLPFRDEVLDPVPAAHPHAERLDPVELPGEDVTWQPVCRDAVPHHPAGFGTRIANLHLVPEPGKVIGSREPTRAGPDHEHPPAAASRRSIEEPALLQREVAQEPLDRVDRNGAVELGAVADALARVVTDPTVDRRQRIVRDELTPCLLMPARLRVRQPGLDVLAGGAAGVARRKQVDVDGRRSRTGPVFAWPCTRSGSDARSR